MRFWCSSEPRARRAIAAAIRVPFEEFLAGFALAWEQGSRTAEEVDQRSGLYVAGLYGHLMANRKLLLALIRAAQEDGAEAGLVALDRSLDHHVRV